MEQSSLDAQTLMRVRLAALVAIGAPPSSYLANLAVAGDVGLEIEDFQNVLIAVAPIVGTARVAAAAGNAARGLGLAALIAEDETADG